MCHCWPGPPLQLARSTSVPLAVPPPATSRHWPACRTVPSGRGVHCWAASPLQGAVTTGPPVWLATHWPGSCDWTGPAGSAHDRPAPVAHDPSHTRLPLVPLTDPLRHSPAVPLTRCAPVPTVHCWLA